MDISFLIPVYNTSIFLADCIKSIVSQTEDDYEYEIICIDDCSKDDSYNTLIALQKQYNCIKIFQNEKNSGVSTTRNNLIKKAEGKYIWFVDSDDCLYNGVVKQLYNIAKKRNSDAVVGMVKSVDCDFKYDNYNFDNQKLKYNVVQKKGTSSVYSGSNIFRGIYRRDIIIKNDVYFNNSIKYGEDTLWAFLFGNYAEEIVSVDGITYLYRSNPNSAMHKRDINSYKVRYQSFYNFYNALKDYPKEKIKDKLACVIKTYNCQYVAIQCLVQVMDRKYIKQQFKKLKLENFYPYKYQKQIVCQSSRKYRILIYFLSKKLTFWLIHFGCWLKLKK